MSWRVATISLEKEVVGVGVLGEEESTAENTTFGAKFQYPFQDMPRDPALGLVHIRSTLNSKGWIL